MTRWVLLHSASSGLPGGGGCSPTHARSFPVTATLIALPSPCFPAGAFPSWPGPCNQIRYSRNRRIAGEFCENPMDASEEDHVDCGPSVPPPRERDPVRPDAAAPGAGGRGAGFLVG